MKDRPPRACQAELLYENGQLVEQLATCEPLLVGKTEVLALQVHCYPCSPYI